MKEGAGLEFNKESREKNVRNKTKGGKQRPDLFFPLMQSAECGDELIRHMIKTFCNHFTN